MYKSKNLIGWPYAYRCRCGQSFKWTKDLNSHQRKCRK